MIELFRDKSGKGLCALCDGVVDKKKAHITLDIKGIPPFLFFFHIDHYRVFVESLEDYVKKNESLVIENFVKLNKYRIKEESKIAVEQGIKLEFEGDIREVMTFKVYF